MQETPAQGMGVHITAKMGRHDKWPVICDEMRRSPGRGKRLVTGVSCDLVIGWMVL